jgi:hypothetical protein
LLKSACLTSSKIVRSCDLHGSSLTTKSIVGMETGRQTNQAVRPTSPDLSDLIAYILLTYLKTIKDKLVMIGIKPKLMKCTFELTYLKTIRAKVVMFGIKPKLMNCTFELTY